ncbi:hypothetical protein IL306_011581 [Fusarium sp. DS 682]|nr:hypothetical protein IL306_011581 [Fusarium sp. DS 682]
MIDEASQFVTELGIAPLVARSLSSFKTLISTLQRDPAQVSQVDTYLARFKLWAGNLGAHRKSGSGSLEYRLRDASIEQGIDVLSSVKIEILTTTCEGHDQVENDLADYFNDDEDSDKSEIEKTLDEIAHVIACLLRLSITIRNPAPHDLFLSREEEGLIESFVHWDSNHVREKFTNVDKNLADRLGRAMARRRLYFKYRKEHKHRLARGLDEDEDEQAMTVASSLPEHLKEAGETRSDQFGIVDDGGSDTSVTSYATSKPDSNQPRVPPIPKEYIDGPFKCPFCQMIVSMETRHAWKFKNHVKMDHEYNMSPEKIYALCNLSSRTDIAKVNGQCPLCCDFQVKSENQYEKHIGQHLEHLALFTLPDTGEEGNEEDKEAERTEEEQLSDGDEGDEDEQDWLDTNRPRSEEAEIATFKALEEIAKAAEKRKEAEAQIQKEAEEAFNRRMEDMRLAQEEAKKAIEMAKLEAEMAARERIEAEQKAEEEAHLKFEAEMEAAEDQRKVEAKARFQAEEEAREKYEAALKEVEEERKAKAAARAQAEKESNTTDLTRSSSSDSDNATIKVSGSAFVRVAGAEIGSGCRD